MARFILRRLLLSIPLMIGISFVTFAIINLVPGSPLANLQVNPRMRPEDVERIRQNLGLGNPWPIRYVKWLSNVAQGDLGISLTNSTPVADRILNVLPNTLLLTSVALVVGLLISIPLGVYSAVKRNSWFDNSVTIGSMALFAIPSFWLALLLILLFAVKFNEWGLPALPVSGYKSLRGESGLGDRIEHLILPAVALTLPDLAFWTRYIRSSMLEVIRQDYVRTAEAKGLRDKSVLYGHAFRNALLPLVTLVALSLPGLFGGAVIIESVFAWNGMGRLATTAARSNDYTLIMGTVLVFSLMTVLSNIVADVLYGVLDPRIRHSTQR